MKRKKWSSLNENIDKQSHAFKGSTSLHKSKILDSFNPELQLQDNKSAIKNKLTVLFS